VDVVNKALTIIQNTPRESIKKPAAYFRSLVEKKLNGRGKKESEHEHYAPN
jgi:hypothetical protein